MRESVPCEPGWQKMVATIVDLEGVRVWRDPRQLFAGTFRHERRRLTWWLNSEVSMVLLVGWVYR